MFFLPTDDRQYVYSESHSIFLQSYIKLAFATEKVRRKDNCTHVVHISKLNHGPDRRGLWPGPLGGVIHVAILCSS